MMSEYQKEQLVEMIREIREHCLNLGQQKMSKAERWKQSIGILLSTDHLITVFNLNPKEILADSEQNNYYPHHYMENK